MFDIIEAVIIMEKILSIGNSFSTDATTYLEPLSAKAKRNLMVRNLFVGGCSLEMHVNNLETDQLVYEYQKNGEFLNLISLKNALKMAEWDHITLQQASHYSGFYETYEPYLSKLVKTIKAICPNARLHWHQTWAYEHDSDHPNFPDYNSSQQEMYAKIKSVSNLVASNYSFSLIPVGSVIQAVREHPSFDSRNGGLTLCRDGFHLSYTYGRYLAALVWAYHFLGETALKSTFVPFGAELNLLDVIRQKTIHYFSSLKQE